MGACPSIPRVAEPETRGPAVVRRVAWVSDASPFCRSAPVRAGGLEIALEWLVTMGEALRRVAAGACDAVLVNLPLAGWEAEAILAAIRRCSPAVPVFLNAPGASPPEACRWMEMGVEFVYGGAVPCEDLAARIGDRLPGAAPAEPWRQLLVGGSPAMEAVCSLVRLVASRRSTVLITGETGTGKELVARALHLAGPRARQALVAVNCSAIPEHLLEAELFGHVRGAFTGAVQPRVGRFELADRGTLFLDEIGDLPLDFQTKLLRFLQEREFQRLGSSETLRVDVRVVAATHVDLVGRVEQGRFREDLFYRLNVVPITTPPLRERPEDIPALVRHFLQKICAIEQLPPKRVFPEALERLKRYPWPGNVRQLENAVEMAVALSGEREVLHAEDFRLPLASPQAPSAISATPDLPLPPEGLDFEETVNRFERQLLEQALLRTGGNKKRAAEILRLKRTTLTAKWRSLQGTR
jgi:DNA-binding NtrC family response regulator